MLDWLPTLTEATGIPKLKDIGEQLLNPCLLEGEAIPLTCVPSETGGPLLPINPVYHANGRDFDPLYLDGYNFLPRLDDLDSNGLSASVVSPRHEFFYIADDGSPSALRFDDWKMLFLEQRAEGYDVWSEPFVNLRAPILVNLRRDPFERAPSASSNYVLWKSARNFLAVPAQGYVAQFLDTLRNYPPRQTPSSFTIDSLLEDLEKDLENMRLED